jgi:hypothetical protein
MRSPVSSNTPSGSRVGSKAGVYFSRSKARQARSLAVLWRPEGALSFNSRMSGRRSCRKGHPGWGNGGQARQGSANGIMPPRLPQQYEGWLPLAADVYSLLVPGLAGKGRQDRQVVMLSEHLAGGRVHEMGYLILTHGRVVCRIQWLGNG